MNKFLLIKPSLVAIIFYTVSCTVSPRIAASNTGSINNSNIVVDGKMFATVFQQRAGEYRALCLQAFNIAHIRVDEIVRTQIEKPKAIITDIDETILNNSPYEAHQVLQGKDYEQASWMEWTAMENADTVPGAATFLKYAASKGIEIFYITNRSSPEKNVTLKNLTKFNLPNADADHIYLMESTSSKETRRKSVEANHTVVMLLGDNLGDFSFLFDKKTASERMQNVDASVNDFGNRFIVLPNPVYGDWESVIYKYDYSLTAAQKDSAIKASLISY